MHRAYASSPRSDAVPAASDGTTCALCFTERKPVPVYRRTRIPVRQNVLPPTLEGALAVPSGELDLRLCAGCGLVFNAAFQESMVDYGRLYDATQMSSRIFAEYVGSVLDKLIADGVTNKRVVEIGCGKGDFIQRLCARGDNHGIGYDTSYVGPSSVLDGRVRFVRSYYVGPELDRADVVLCRLVIGHVPRPAHLMRSLRAALDDTASAPRVYIETPALEWVLENRAWWDLFYEHCSYFSAVGLRNVLRAAGLEPISMERVFGGQYHWVSARPVAEPPPLEPAAVSATTAAFDAIEKQGPARWRSTVQYWASQGGTAVWGSGAKGVTFANLVDPRGTDLRFVVDINPAKQGRFVPGTGHPVVGPEALRNSGVTRAIVMNPLYMDESAAILRKLDISNVQLIPVEEANGR